MKGFVNFITEPIYLFIIGCFFFGYMYYLSQISSTLRFYIKEKSKETRNQEIAMTELIQKMREQLKFLKAQQNIGVR